jgi:hypothetical protein
MMYHHWPDLKFETGEILPEIKQNEILMIQYLTDSIKEIYFIS